MLNPNPKKTLILTLNRINMKEKIFKITPGRKLFFIAELNFRLMDGGLMDGGSDQWATSCIRERWLVHVMVDCSHFMVNKEVISWEQRGKLA